VNHVNLINACWELFIKTIEKIITPTNIKTTKARILRTLSVRKNIFTVKRWKWEKIDLKKSPISNRLWESNFRFEGLHLLTECKLLKVLRFPIKAARLLTYNNCTALYSTELRCKVLFCIAFSFRRYLFLLYVLNPPFFTSISNRSSTIYFMSLNFDLHTIIMTSYNLFTDSSLVENCFIICRGVYFDHCLHQFFLEM